MNPRPATAAASAVPAASARWNRAGQGLPHHPPVHSEPLGHSLDRVHPVGVLPSDTNDQRLIAHQYMQVLGFEVSCAEV